MERIRPTEQELKEVLEFHEYGRFASIRNIINANRLEGQRFRILDVGGRGNRMRDFFPQDEVYYLDPLVEQNTDTNYIAGDGCAMSLTDASFDWVVSTDTFEHIQPERRADFLSENTRVARLGVLLCAPFFSRNVLEAEKTANEEYKLLSGIDHPWLIEHIQYGLPHEDEVTQFIQQHGYNYQRLPNNQLLFWSLFISINFYVDKELQPEIKELWKKYNAFYNTYIFPFDHEEPAYRTVFFIKKDSALKNFIPPTGTVDPEKQLMLIQQFTELVSRIGRYYIQSNTATYEHFVKVKSMLEAKDIDISNLQKSISALQSDFQKTIIKKDIDISNLQKSISTLQSDFQKTITQKNTDINNLQLGLSELHSVLGKKDQELQEIVRTIDALQYQLKEKEEESTEQRDLFIQTLQLKDQHIRNIEAQLLLKQQELQHLHSSKFWKMRTLYLRIKQWRPSEGVAIAKKGYAVLQREGIHTFLDYLKQYLLHGRAYFKDLAMRLPEYAYHQWIQTHEQWNDTEIKKEIQQLSYSPSFSIITPVYNTDPKWLNAAIHSVLAQSYSNWQLCLYDDASTSQKTIDCLNAWKKKDPRIIVRLGKTNQHISAASNEALRLATGEFIALLDHDDTLAPHALYEVVRLLNANRKLDFIYSDEDKIDIHEQRNTPFFKPDWSPDLFLSMMYTCHFAVYRKKIIDEIGGFRKGFEGSQDYDLTLRVIERITADHIAHISKILYHWRQIPGSTASSSTADTKTYAQVSAHKALQEYLDRNHLNAKVEEGYTNGRFRIRWQHSKQPLVSIIIPFRDRPELLRACVGSLLKLTDYTNFELLLVDNQSQEQETLQLLDELGKHSKIRVLHYDEPFNYSSINNFAAKRAVGGYLLLLNNDTTIINKDWLSAMMEDAQRPEVGIVGAKLLYPNDSIQHAGVVLGVGGIAGHAFKYAPAESEGYFSQLRVTRNCSAVTGACLLIKKNIYEQVGGLNEKKLAVSFNDVDLCLKVREAGYRILYSPYARLYHYESISRGNDEENRLKDPKRYKRLLSEQKYMHETWGSLLQRDPYYNPNLTLTSEDYSLKN